MKVYTKYLTYKTSERIQIVHITPDVEQALMKSGVKEGLCLVSSMHTTSSVFVNDHESGLLEDMKKWLEDKVPFDPDRYLHNETGEDNAHAHLKRAIFGRETTVPVTDGKLDLGRWGEIFYGEFDGGREKRVVVKIIGE